MSSDRRYVYRVPVLMPTSSAAADTTFVAGKAYRLSDLRHCSFRRQVMPVQARQGNNKSHSTTSDRSFGDAHTWAAPNPQKLSKNRS